MISTFLSKFNISRGCVAKKIMQSFISCKITENSVSLSYVRVRLQIIPDIPWRVIKCVMLDNPSIQCKLNPRINMLSHLKLITRGGGGIIIKFHFDHAPPRRVKSIDWSNKFTKKKYKNGDNDITNTKITIIICRGIYSIINSNYIKILQTPTK